MKRTIRGILLTVLVFLFCMTCATADPAVETQRISGATRYDTALATANMLKENLGREKFSSVVVANGDNYPDALSGSYLAHKVGAPILLVNRGTVDKVVSYIRSNVEEGGTVYLLGGAAVVPETIRTRLVVGDIVYWVKSGAVYHTHRDCRSLAGTSSPVQSGTYEQAIAAGKSRLCKNCENMDRGKMTLTIIRLGGSNRLDTNYRILQQAGINGKELMVCSASGFADSLSASAVDRPILLVGSHLTETQKNWLATSGISDFYIIGGEGAVSADVAAELASFGTVNRIGGADRFETSALVAGTFFPGERETMVLAYGHNFPDGLCGGPLAMSMDSPLLLARNSPDGYIPARSYQMEAAASQIIVLGGPTLISDRTVQEIIAQ